MWVRVLFLLSCFSIALSACHNEPYETPTLDIISFVDKTTGGPAMTFTYAGDKLLTYKKVASGVTQSSMVFYYRGESLEYITSDSAVTVKADTISRSALLSFKRTFFEKVGETTTDRTYLYTSDSAFVYHKADSSYEYTGVTQDTAFVYQREITYDADGNPVHVKATSWTNNIPTEVVVDYTWTNGNVTRSFTTTTTNGVSSVRDMIFRYDDQNGVYKNRSEYLFTLDPREFYWLSKNNPTMLNDGSGEQLNIFWYNKLGYPSNYQNAAGTTFGMGYRQVSN